MAKSRYICTRIKLKNDTIMAKKLTKSLTDRKVFGVCAGLAEYFDTDPTLARVGFLFFTVLTGFIPGLVLYFLMGLIMPDKGAQ